MKVRLVRKLANRINDIDLTARAVADDRELEGLEVRRPTLEDVYLELVDGGES